MCMCALCVYVSLFVCVTGIHLCVLEVICISDYLCLFMHLCVCACVCVFVNCEFVYVYMHM